MLKSVLKDRELAKFLLSRVRGADRVIFVFVLIGKLSIVVFDLAGIFLVGAVLAASTGTTISKQSVVGRGLQLVGELGFSSAPAGLLLFAIFFFCLKALLSIALSFIAGRFSARIELETSSSVFRSFLRDGFRTSFLQKPAKTSQALTSGMSTLVGQSIVTSTTIVGETFLVLAISAALALTNLSLFLILAGFFALVVFVLHRLVAKRAVDGATAIHKTNLQTQTLIFDVLSNIRVISTSGVQGNFLKEFAWSRRQNAEEFARYQLTTSLPRHVLDISVMVGALIVFLAVAVLGPSAIPAATVGVYIAGLFRIVSSILPLQSAIVTWSRIEVESRPSRQLSAELALAETIQVGPHPSSKALGVGGVTVRLSEVAFRYSEEEPTVLEGADLTIFPGEKVALVGESGAGKSTLADLIMGLQVPTHGTVSLNEESATDFRRRESAMMSYLPQESRLIAGTVYENIAFRFEPPSREELDYVSWLIRQVGLGSLLAELPNGLMTRVGNGEREFSGGQIQRIGLARSLYGRPKLLVLDEPTSALDVVSEQHIMDLVRDLAREVTVVVISHSPKTSNLVDRVFRVQGGKVTEEK